MVGKKKEHPKEKHKLHLRNKHRERYNFKQLISSCPELSAFVKPNIYNDDSIDFFDPEAVKMLNKALLKHHYGIKFWEIPANYLCPPIPGRADYIHHIADVLRGSNFGKIPEGPKFKCIDIGVGANCIYPIIGNVEYGWSFIGTDIDAVSIASATKIVKENSFLEGKVELRHQPKARDIFYGVLRKEERVDLAICNPPFHSSAEAAQEGSLRKLKNLGQKKTETPTLNFGGQSNELWCEGGEKRFIQDFIRESEKFAQSCLWFSTLISKQSNLKMVYKALDDAHTAEIKTVPMGQGNKASRIVAWTFQSTLKHKEWRDTRWGDKKVGISEETPKTN